MARPQPTTPVPTSLETRKDQEYITQIREYKLITPLFGGGVEPGEADPVTVVRASEVRGHLRFWWRATRGGQFGGDLMKMKAAEDLLWGAASTNDAPRPSQVQVAITLIDAGNPVVITDRSGRPMEDRQGRPLSAGAPQSPYSYGAFPLNDKPDATLREGIRFTLVLSFSEAARVDLAATLWAWETFGGLGARTRRGFGALACVKIDKQVADYPPPDPSGAAEWIRQKLREYVISEQVPDTVPHLSHSSQFVITRSRQAADEIWRTQLLDKLKAFRQQRPMNRLVENGRPISRPGRNRWPEQDEVRRLTRRRMPRHAQEISNVRKFPRAAFGLPLIVQYKRDDQRNGDPAGNNTVNVEGKERFASPLILRPLACATGFVGLALLLEGSRVPEQAILTTQQGKYAVRTNLTKEETAQIMDGNDRVPLLGGETDILRAFLHFLKEA